MRNPIFPGLLERAEDHLSNAADRFERGCRKHLGLPNGPILPWTTGQHRFFFKLTNLRFTEAVVLACLSFYLTDENLRWMLQMDLDEKKRDFPPEERQLLSQLIHSKRTMLKVLVLSPRWTSASFCSLVTQFSCEYRSRVNRISELGKVQIPQRVRGYRDHGSARRRDQLRFNGRGESDCVLTLLQIQMEEKKDRAEKNLQTQKEILEWPYTFFSLMEAEMPPATRDP